MILMFPLGALALPPVAPNAVEATAATQIRVQAVTPKTFLEVTDATPGVRDLQTWLMTVGAVPTPAGLRIVGGNQPFLVVDHVSHDSVSGFVPALEPRLLVGIRSDAPKLGHR